MSERMPMTASGMQERFLEPSKQKFNDYKQSISKYVAIKSLDGIVWFSSITKRATNKFVNEEEEGGFQGSAAYTHDDGDSRALPANKLLQVCCHLQQVRS